MPVLRVTLNSGETHDVQIVPETVVQFQTTTKDGRGHDQHETFAWCDVASIETAAAPKQRKAKAEPEPAAEPAFPLPNQDLGEPAPEKDA